MTKFLSKYFKPSQISLIYIALAIASVFLITIIFSSSTSKKEREYYEKPIKTVISAKNTREIGVDSINKQVIGINKDVGEVESRLERLEGENKRLKGEAKSYEELLSAVKDLQGELEKESDKTKKMQERQKSEVKAAVDFALKEHDFNTVTPTGNLDPKSSKATPIVRRKKSETDNMFNYGGADADPYESNNTFKEVAPQVGDGRAEMLFSIIEEPIQFEEDEQYKLHVPIGSILTGVSITGIDAPTTAESSDSPLPVLIRIKKEAVLPNLFELEEVRECFVLMAGYGDLASERVYLRGEAVSCMREDGQVIETKFAAFAVGEDGKAGLKGTLVSRNSKVLLNAMASGFMSGLASAFNVNPVPVISTDATGTQDYNSVFSANAVQGGAAQGAATAFEKLADYYMDLADAMHPVIEIGAGRVVDIVITQGVKL